MKKPMVSVLLAAYNGDKFISEQLDTILNQEGVDVRIFVSIDESTDRTEAVVKKYCKLDSRVILLDSRGRIGSAGLNFFRLICDVNAFDDSFFALADQDDIWFPDKLIKAVNILSNNAYDCYSSNVIAFWEDGRKKIINKAQPQRKFDFLFEAAGPGCTYVFTNCFFESLKIFMFSNIRFMSNISLHDWFIYAFARSNGFKWFIDKNPGLMYRQHALNVMGANSGLFQLFSRLNKMFNGWWFCQIHLIIFLLYRHDESTYQFFYKNDKLNLYNMCRNVFQIRRKVSESVFTFAILCLFRLIKPKHLIKFN